MIYIEQIWFLYQISVLYEKIDLLKKLKRYKKAVQVLEYVYNINRNNKQNIKNYNKIKKELQSFIMDNYELKNHNMINPYIILMAISKYDKKETKNLQGTINDVENMYRSTCNTSIKGITRIKTFSNYFLRNGKLED